MARCEEESVDAARILLSLRYRKLRRWPDWVPRSSEEEPVEEVERKVHVPRLHRSPRRVVVRGAAWWAPREVVRAWMRRYGGSGASPVREDGGKETPKVKVACRTEMYYVAPPPGSGPSTSDVDRARSEKVAARKERMTATSPGTPLDYGPAAGSPASSSGDDATRSSPAKRIAPGAIGSRGGEAGCSSPAKRPRADLDVAAANDEEPNPKPEKKTGEEDCRDEKGHLLFDLNKDVAWWED